MERLHDGRELLAMRTNQVQWNRLAGVAWQHDLQPASGYVVADVDPRLVGDSLSRDGPTPDHIGIVTEQGTLDFDPVPSAVAFEMPAIVDEGVIRTTLSERFGSLNVETLRRAHALVESGRTQGKIVLEGF
ncbi:MAG: zinc-binding dehydrogenase [Halomonas sp.]|jgi:hypothetical protein|nr:zinc-binding dehydrogenase [Halomonas sp.]